MLFVVRLIGLDMESDMDVARNTLKVFAVIAVYLVMYDKDGID